MRILELFQQSPLLAIAFLVIMVIALTVHEFSHAWVAYHLGDDTPMLQGRVTLNPAAHLDPIGSIAFIVLGFGWGRPVEYNPMRLKRHVDELLVALAGPASNLLMAIFFNILVRLTSNALPGYAQLFDLASYINVLLASFNIIPIPPLDGSSIVAYFWPEYRSLAGGQVGLIILLAIMFIPFGSYGTLLTIVLTPITNTFTALTHLFGLL